MGIDRHQPGAGRDGRFTEPIEFREFRSVREPRHLREFCLVREPVRVCQPRESRDLGGPQSR